ncbi:Aste57867_2146 [Aphanomyces stellatus]|uniref:Aste57867_2146 protein n=1 Tax=Aphanomyces stellatus TaxID=120398 RepID=A0A485K6T4_9STRA|nr:hypothetical protein As57867_002141 [Aphanomyces stellatus]VFT79349.1 Aste57867_2146 [Aphanomyces stellatus]
MADNANDTIRGQLQQLEGKLPLPPIDLAKKCDSIVHEAVASLQKCPKTTSSNYESEIRRLEQQGGVLKERVQHLNERAIRQRSTKLLSQLTASKSELKTKGNIWLDKRIAAKTPFTISMLEGELLRLHSSFEFATPNPELDEVDFEQEMQEFHAQLLEDLHRQYTLHIRHVVLQYIAAAKAKLDNEMQVIVLPQPEAQLHNRILESKERVVLEIAGEMQGWSFPQEEMIHFGNTVGEYTRQLEETYKKQNKLASQNAASREAAAQYQKAKDELAKQLHTMIIQSIPTSDETMNQIYESAVLNTCKKLSEGNQIKHAQMLQSLQADVATMMDQLRAINKKEIENNALMNAAENERQKLEQLTNQVQKTNELATQREKEMQSKLQEKEQKSKRLMNELTSQTEKTEAMERQLKEWQQKSTELAVEKKRNEAEAFQMASKERQATKKLVEERAQKERQLQVQMQAIQRQLEEQQHLLKVKEKEAKAAEIAEEKTRRLAQEKDQALKMAQDERTLRDQLSQDVSIQQAKVAQLESKISTLMRQKSIEAQQLEGTLSNEQRKTQRLELELKRMQDKARELDEEKELWRRQVMDMEQTKQAMSHRVAEESARRAVAEDAAQQAAEAAQVAAKAAIEAMDVTPEKKRKPEKQAASTAGKKTKKMEGKSPMPKLSLEEVKRRAKEEVDKRVSERISRMKK